MKNNLGRIILVIIVIIASIAIGIYAYTNLVNVDDPVVTPTPTETPIVEDNKIDIVNYTVYDFEELDFDFVIAKFRIKANSSIEVLNLENYVTEENIRLSEVLDYVPELEMNGYYLGKQNVYYELNQSNTNYFVNLFIPVENSDLSKLTLDCIADDSSFTFDLSDKVTATADLVYVPEDVITDGNTYTMIVSSAELLPKDGFIRTFSDGTVIENGFPSTAEVYAFNVVASSLNEDVVIIESAVYEVADSNDSFEALNEQYSNIYYNNIVGSSITDDSQGYVFLVTLNPEKEPITYQGILKIQIKGVLNPIQIEVDLE